MHNWDKICDESGPLVWTTVYRVLNDYAQALDCYQDVFLEAFERTQNRAVRNPQESAGRSRRDSGAGCA